MQIAKLTECEEIVMKAVWDCPKAPVLSDILTSVTTVYRKDWKPQTVSTFLKKLVNKKYLKSQRNGRVHTYQILIPESAYKQFLYKRLLHFWYNNDAAACCQEMLLNGDLRKEDIENYG